MRKIIVLDTNVLLHAADSLEVFQEHIVIVHWVVLEELDRKKSEPGLVGFNARAISKKLIKLCEEGDISKGVVVNTQGGEVVVDHTPCVATYGAAVESVDNFLIQYCRELQSSRQSEQVVLVTKDNNLRIKAASKKVKCQLYYNDQVEEQYTGIKQVMVAPNIVSAIYNEKSISIYEVFNSLEEVYPNMCVTLINEHDPQRVALSIVDSVCKKIKLISTNTNCSVLGIKPMNAEQRYALHLLLDPEIHLVTISGATGSGKTLLSLACGMQQSEQQLYDTVIISRKEMGVSGQRPAFLPGNEQEKLMPWLRGVNICLNKIARTHQPNIEKTMLGEIDSAADFYRLTGLITPVTLDYVRSATFDGFMLLEEAQNFHKKEIKTLITRAGKCKAVLTGDINQIDDIFLNKHDNGMTHVINKMKGWRRYAHIHLNETVRSELAKEADKRL